MSSIGFAPTLAGLSYETEAPVLSSFVKGMKFCFGIAGGVLLLGFFVAVYGGKYREIETEKSVTSVVKQEGL